MEKKINVELTQDQRDSLDRIFASYKERVGSMEEHIDFCLSKCGDGYCPAMKGQPGHPCLEYICKFCPRVKGMSPEEKTKYCEFCRGEE